MWFVKKTSAGKLYKLILKKNLKDWQLRLDTMVKTSKKIASGGGDILIIHDQVLRCAYNKTRQQEDIVDDVKERFKGCDVMLVTSPGRTTIEIRWNK